MIPIAEHLGLGIHRMRNLIEDLPERVEPYIAFDELNQSIPLVKGPFRFVGSREGNLDSDLIFRWLPSTAIEFEGPCSLARPDLEEEWSLESDNPRLNVPVLLTNVTSIAIPTPVKGIILEPLDLGDTPFEVLRFSLTNFPEYNGDAVRYKLGDSQGVMRGRLRVCADSGECRLDEIPEMHDLRKVAKRDSGYVISHVGEWRPSSGKVTIVDANATLDMLHIWFGLLRCAWSGPLFPQGLVDGKVVWRRHAAWRLGESREVSTWLPQHKPLDLSAMFAGFVRHWNDLAWQGALRSSVSWLVEANSSGRAQESKIILSQVALELLSWVQIVETQQLHSRSDFKRLSAAGRIRVLLQQIGVPAAIPEYMTNLPNLCQGDAFDGPGVITSVRNALVHASEDNRAIIGTLNGMTLYECSQLALQYVELALLAICGHNGHYARRGWKGWKADDEVLVPWMTKG